ncbi:Panacea domain-containing protein [Corticicoccus populi]|uniref:Panacea domain-containing protein n=1 Tax=Corticicoccus populi TaxID=1812821 RepID=A0ABW5WY45_9STAP
MYKLFMLVSQPSSNLERIGWRKLVTSPSDLEEIQAVKRQLSDLNIEHKFSNHLVSNDGEDMDSIKTKDSFFSDIIFIDDTEKFIELTKISGKQLEAFDIANYILSLKPMTHLKLQKILYIAFERFFIKTNKTLYSNKIVAFDYGPVTLEVFKKYYKNKKVLKNEDDDDSLIQIQNKAISPTVAKIMLSDEGLNVMDIVDSVVTEYAQLNAWDMVDITHKEGTAWDKAYKIGRNTEITTEIINESIAT